MVKALINNTAQAIYGPSMRAASMYQDFEGAQFSPGCHGYPRGARLENFMIFLKARFLRVH
jgi:hypothetical protein